MPRSARAGASSVGGLASNAEGIARESARAAVASASPCSSHAHSGRPMRPCASDPAILSLPSLSIPCAKSISWPETKHMPGHRRVASARLELLEEARSYAARRRVASAARAAVGSGRKDIDRPTRGAPRSATSSEASRSSCLPLMSGPTSSGVVRPARRSGRVHGVAVHLANHDVTLSAVSRRRSRSCRSISGGWGGVSWAPRSRHSTSTSAWGSPGATARGGVEYNYRRGGHALDATVDVHRAVRRTRPFMGAEVGMRRVRRTAAWTGRSRPARAPRGGSCHSDASRALLAPR